MALPCTEYFLCSKGCAKPDLLIPLLNTHKISLGRHYEALHLQMGPLGLGLDPGPDKVTQLFLPFEAHRGEEVTVRKLWKSPGSAGNSSLHGRRVVVSMPALGGLGGTALQTGCHSAWRVLRSRNLAHALQLH